MVILAYHKVSDKKEEALSVTREVFFRQMDYLHRAHYRVVPLEEFVTQKTNLPRKTVVLTFDDGYRDNFLNAFPVLKKYQMPAAVFLITDRLGKRYENEEMLSWEEVRTMQSEGISFASHSLSHPHLKDISEEEVARELKESKAAIEKNTNARVRFFAPPYGEYSPLIAEAARGAGYEKILITPTKRFAPYPEVVLRRRGIYHDNSMLIFKIKLWLGESSV